MIAKVHAYGFDKTSAEYLKDYLSHRKLKIKINKTLSNWTNILHGVPQGFILDSLIFTVFLYDFLLFKPDINLVSYADDNTPFEMDGSSELEVINEIKKLSSTCSEKFFGIKIDNKLTLEEYVEGMCKKVSQKVSAVARILSLMRFEQRKCIVDLFITSHYPYYPLV